MWGRPTRCLCCHELCRSCIQADTNSRTVPRFARPQETFPYVEAARNGDLAMLRWLKLRSCPYNGYDLYDEVNGALDQEVSVNEQAVCGWFRDNGFPGDWLEEDSD